IRLCFCATSRRGTWIEKRAMKFSASSRRSTASTARPSSWSRTTPTRRPAPAARSTSTRASSQRRSRSDRNVKFFYLVWSNLKRKKLRTSLTLLSIFVAFLLFGLLCTIKEAFTGGVSAAGADRLVVRHKVSLIMTLPVTYQDRIERIPGVDMVSHATWLNGTY